MVYPPPTLVVSVVPMINRRASAVLAGLAALSLAGCATSEDLRRQDEARCASYGFAPGTPDFAVCLQREDIARRNGATGLTFGFGFSGGF